MADSPATRPSLLVRIRDGRDAGAWGQFVELYAPVVYGFARKRGLQDADAADLTQEVLRAVVSAVGRLDYDPATRLVPRLAVHGRPQQALHDFLTPPAAARPGQRRHAVRRHCSEQQPARRTRGGLWEQEYEQRLFAWAAEQVRGRVPAKRPGRRSGGPPSRARAARRSPTAWA